HRGPLYPRFPDILINSRNWLTGGASSPSRHTMPSSRYRAGSSGIRFVAFKYGSSSGNNAQPKPAVTSPETVVSSMDSNTNRGTKPASADKEFNSMRVP